MTTAKPTPGPYTIHEFTAGVAVRAVDGGTNIAIATFWDGDTMQVPNHERAKANARAFVDGMEAAEKMERIRAAMRDTRLDSHQLIGEIRNILVSLEAKP